MNETPIVFTNDSQTLRGILHQPDTSDTNTGMVFLHGWATYRIGPHRILVDAARRFTTAGFPCLRFDFRGRGESDGDTDAATLLDMIDDAAQAVDFLTAETGVENVVLAGLCSGGEVAVGAAMSRPCIARLILWSTPLLARQAQGHNTQTDVRKTAHYAGTYVRKIFRRETWKKLVQGRLHPRTIFRVLFSHFREPKPDARMKETDLLQAFTGFQGPMLFVYGGNDPEAPAAQAAYQHLAQTHDLDASFHTIPEANHNFYSLAWKQNLLDATEQWLKT